MKDVKHTPIKIMEVNYEEMQDNVFLRSHQKQLYMEGVFDVKDDDWVPMKEFQNIVYDKADSYLIMNWDRNHPFQYLTTDLYGFSIYIRMDKFDNVSVIRYNKISGEMNFDSYADNGIHSILESIDFSSYNTAGMAYNTFNVKFLPESVRTDYTRGYRYMATVDTNGVYHLIPVVSRMQINDIYYSEDKKIPHQFEIDVNMEICYHSGIHRIIHHDNDVGYIQFTMDDRPNANSIVRIVPTFRFDSMLLTSFKYKGFDDVKKFVDSHTRGYGAVYDTNIDEFNNAVAVTNDGSVYTFGVDYKAKKYSYGNPDTVNIIGTYFYDTVTGLVYKSVPKPAMN